VRRARPHLALRRGAQLVREAEHVIERHVGLDGDVIDALHPLDAALALREQRHSGT